MIPSLKKERCSRTQPGRAGLVRRHRMRVRLTLDGGWNTPYAISINWWVCGPTLQLPIQSPVVNGLEDVLRADGVAVGEIGDGAGDAEDLVVGAGGEA